MDFGNRWKALEELERSQKEQVFMESKDRKSRLEQEMIVGMGEEQERLIRMEMERQSAELKVFRTKKSFWIEIHVHVVCVYTYSRRIDFFVKRFSQLTDYNQAFFQRAV